MYLPEDVRDAGVQCNIGVESWTRYRERKAEVLTQAAEEVLVMVREAEETGRLDLIDSEKTISQNREALAQPRSHRSHPY